MATRSRIAIERNDGSIDSIYCHWDGYPENVGLLLEKYYNKYNKINELIDLGDLSHLDVRINPIGEHSFDQPEKGTTISYKRDRGEKNTECKHHNDYNEFCKNCLDSDQNYAYLYRNNNWYVSYIPYGEGNLEFENLKEVLKELNVDFKEEGLDL